jgi:hypothetical protein
MDANTLRGEHADAPPRRPQADTVPEAELQNLHKKRKLIERQCAPACARADWRLMRARAVPARRCWLLRPPDARLSRRP